MKGFQATYHAAEHLLRRNILSSELALELFLLELSDSFGVI